MNMQNNRPVTLASPKTIDVTKHSLHPRSKHKERYDLQSLAQICPELQQYICINKNNDLSIDFSNPTAVKLLNKAILQHSYGLRTWEIPNGYLCPPIPGRADYIHHVADLLAASNNNHIPHGHIVRILDIGTGANCIYPIIGSSEYGWSFVGSDIDPVAIVSAENILKNNPQLRDAVELRLQMAPSNIFTGIIKKEDFFAISICNPPFHASLQQAQHGTQRKWKNLGKPSGSGRSANPRLTLNFGGQHNELFCEGGEAAFISRMIDESALFPYQCLWFSTLVSKDSHLPGIYRKLSEARVINRVTINMAQGQKKSRFVAWTFFHKSQHASWSKNHLIPS